MLSTPEVSKGLKSAPFDADEKVFNKILSPEYLNQPGAKIALKFLDTLGIPHGQWSTYNPEKPKNDKIIAENLTNKTGVIHEKYGISFISRDPRHFLENLDPKLLNAMDPKLAGIFQNEFDHYEAKKNRGEILPFAYVRLPGDVDCVLKGYWHERNWQREHGEYLAKTAKNAKVLCIEGVTGEKYGNSLKLRWEGKSGEYDELMRKSVSQGFEGFFAEIDMRDDSKIELDSSPDSTGTLDSIFPNLPEEFFQKYFGYLDKFFPEDTKQIGKSQNLKEILRKLSITDEGRYSSENIVNVQNIQSYTPTYVDKNLNVHPQMTGLELGERNFADAMSAIKLHLIANEIRENRIPKGVIVDFEGDAHLQAKYFYLRNPLYAMMTILKSPHFILMRKLAKKDDISSIYSAFSPSQEMFEKMFEQTWKLELGKTEKEPGKTEIEPGSEQMPMKKYKIKGRNKILSEKLKKLNPQV